MSPPPAERFFAYNVIEDEGGPADIWVSYLRPEFGTVVYNLVEGGTERRPAEPDDATLTLILSRRVGVPVYISPLRSPDALWDGNLRGPAVLLDRTEKVEIRKKHGVMRIYVARNGGPTYPYRIPSVALNWFEGDDFMSLQSHFLSPQEALAAAESITFD